MNEKSRTSLRCDQKCILKNSLTLYLFLCGLDYTRLLIYSSLLSIIKVNKSFSSKEKETYPLSKDFLCLQGCVGYLLLYAHLL